MRSISSTLSHRHFSNTSRFIGEIETSAITCIRTRARRTVCVLGVRADFLSLSLVSLHGCCLFRSLGGCLGAGHPGGTAVPVGERHFFLPRISHLALEHQARVARAAHRGHVRSQRRERRRGQLHVEAPRRTGRDSRVL